MLTFVLAGMVVMGFMLPIGLSGPARGVSSVGVTVSPATPEATSTVEVTLDAESGDAIVKRNLESVAVGFEQGSIASVSPSQLQVIVWTPNGTTKENIRVAQATELSKDADERRLVATLNDSLSVNAGDRVRIRIASVQNDESPGVYDARISLNAGGDRTDGPVTASYRIQSAQISFADQRVQDTGEGAEKGEPSMRTVRVRAALPNDGYIAVFTAESGEPGDLVGVKPVKSSNSNRTYRVAVNVSENQGLVAVPYFETGRRVLGQNDSDGFNQLADEPYVRDNEIVQDEAAIALYRPTAQLQAGGSYEAGDQLLFTQGEPNTEYEFSLVEDGTPDEEVIRFQTNGTGVAVLDTTNLSSSKYAIVRVTGSDVVNLDNDGIASAADDGFLITNTSEAAAEDELEGTEASEASGGGLNPMMLILFVLFAFAFGGGAAVIYRRRQSY